MNEIITKRLRITLFQEKHLTQTYVNWLNDPEVVKYSSQRHFFHTLESCKKYWQNFQGSQNYFWAVETLIDDNHIGNLNAYIDKINNTADVGIIIGDRKKWGQGYGLEAWNGVLKFLFKEKKIRKITAGTLEVNRGMVNIAMKAGMHEEGRRYRQEIINNKEVDLLYFGIFFEEIENAINLTNEK